MNNGLVTRRQNFSEYGTEHAPVQVFSVNAGVKGEVALDQASDLIASTVEAVMDAAMGKPLQGNQAWLVHHSLTSAKAVIDALRASYLLEAGE